MKCSRRTSPARIAALALAALAAGCAAPPPPVGTSEAAVLASRGAPTARYDLEGGAHRLEYATGPYG
ncbi:MAG: hypothetical protein KGI36_22185, partial [Burkholderiales bacterium]|nr:hypothetical protein [Burkholderiales bacterium]